MAFNILLGWSKQHDADHDLESLFYVFCWICISREGPGRVRTDFDFEDPRVSWWMGEPNEGPASSGAKKLERFLPVESFERCILADFHTYFDDFRTCAMGLWKLLFTNSFHRKPNLHRDIINVFQEALSGISDVTEGENDGKQLEKDGRETAKPIRSSSI
ncbi:hypothetical protein BD410DRAFT_182875 [Rickenella mellea]|uniref:Fungal-type protein kinase domain-containing protein n=1 Tax=Rickenella mellea TaxID=50990 RepID=A0A4Y7Q710_9AGAM|nr:hypothetical protein BD410DRAFT_182875 [Rickenella mellea]